MNIKSNTPSLDTPTDTATNQALILALKTTTTDADSDYLRYKIELCTNLAMTTGCIAPIDQTSSQTGWSGQNADSSLAYTSGTQAVYTFTSNLIPGTTYYWRSYAIDPAGSNLWSNTQTPSSFTTQFNPFEATQCRIDESNDKSSFTLNWLDRAVDETGYEIQRSVNGGAWSVLVTALPAGTNTYTDSTISYGTSYGYRIAPYKSPGVNGSTSWCTAATLLPNIGVFKFN
jgi:titin